LAKFLHTPPGPYLRAFPRNGHPLTDAIQRIEKLNVLIFGYVYLYVVATTIPNRSGIGTAYMDRSSRQA
jgi:hypothetical protein